MARWAVACALAFAVVVAARPAAADPPSDTKPKAKVSSFAPHHTQSHVYGTPVGKPILHKQKKRAHPPAPATGPAEPIK